MAEEYKKRQKVLMENLGKDTKELAASNQAKYIKSKK